MPTSTPTPTTLSTLDEFVALSNQNDALVKIALQEWSASYEATDSDCPQGYTVIRSHLEICKGFTKTLRQFDWNRVPYKGQERWQNDTAFSKPVQIATSHVRVKGDRATFASAYCAPKGIASLDHTGQLRFVYEDLPPVVSDTDCYWILHQLMADMSPERFRLSVARVRFRNERTMVIEDSRELYYGRLVPVATPSLLPEAVPSEVIVTEIEIEE